MPKKKTPKEYYEECKEKNLDLPIEEYITTHFKINHKCKKGHIYKQSPSAHLRGQGCPICRGTKKKTSQDYIKECKEKGYDLPIEDYINAITKIKHKCNKGHIYLQTPNAHLSGSGCTICNGAFKKTPKEYYQECKEKGYDLPIEDYINAITKIKHKCNKGHIYFQTPNDHLSGKSCPICNNDKKTPKEYYNECREKGLDLPIEDYINAKTKIKHRCGRGHDYIQKPYSHLEDYGCPICKESHGEKFIRNYLDINNIKYIPQKRFDDLKDKTYLSYDFFLPKKNILIEYQGQQHYEICNYFGGEDRLKVQQKHDKLKREYAKKNGYKLLELHYSLDTQEKVNKYLERRIKD